MEVPLAADNLVPFGPFSRCARRGGTMDKSAPPSINHLIFVFGSVMYSRSPSPFSRDAAAFTSGAPPARFPSACLVVAFYTDILPRIPTLFRRKEDAPCISAASLVVCWVSGRCVAGIDSDCLPMLACCFDVVGVISVCCCCP